MIGFSGVVSGETFGFAFGLFRVREEGVALLFWIKGGVLKGGGLGVIFLRVGAF